MKRRRQKGGVAPFLALLLPALTAAGKTAALAGVGTAASYGVKKSLDAVEKRYKSKKRKKRDNDERPFVSSSYFF